MKTLILICSLLATAAFGQYLLVATSSNLELYDISIPLVPIRTSSTEVNNPIKAVYQEDTIYVLCQSQIESYNTSLEKINSARLGEKAFDMLVSDNIYVFSEYKMSVYRKDLVFQRSYTFAEGISKVDSYGNYFLILHSNGKLVCYTKTMNKIWELSGLEPFLGMQVVSNYLFSWTKSRFYMMSFNEGYPVYEKETSLGGSFDQVINIRDNLILLDSNGTLRLMTLQNLKIVDSLNVNAKSISSYGDYVYATTKDGTIRVINILFSTMKLLHSFSSNVVFSKTVSIAAKPKTVMPEEIQPVEVPKVEKKQFEMVGEVKLPLPVKTSCVVWGKNVYSATMTGELISLNLDSKKTSSLKVSFITTSDPVVMKDGTVIMGSWDKSVYLIRDKITRLKTSANISLPAAITPQGFLISDDDGLLLHFDFSGNELWRFNAGNWFVCPPVVHERFGIITLDWLGILRLTDFTGNLIWAIYLEFSKQGMVILSMRNAFVVNNGKLYAIDISSGKILWTFSPDNPLVSYIVSNDKSVFCYDEMGTLYALDLSGKVNWTMKFDELCSVILTESHVLVFTKTQILLLDQNSNKITSQSLAYPPTAHPTMSENGMIYIVSSDRLFIYSIDDKPSLGWAMYLKDQSHSGLFSLNY